MAIIPRRMISRARSLRRRPTDAEQKLWSYLRRGALAGSRFRRQHPIPPYVADFACIEARLIVEADGGGHAESKRDQVRTEYLEARGWRVLRFWNDDILMRTADVMAAIASELSPHPNPPPPPRGREHKAPVE